MPIPDVEVPSWIAWLFIAGVLVTTLRIMFRTRLVSWLTESIRRTVVDAMREVVKEQTEPLRDELKPNGGTSLRDAVDRVERKLCQHVDRSEEDRADLRREIDLLRARIDRDG